MLEIIKSFFKRHKNAANRVLHIVGIPLVIVGIAYLVMAKWKLGAVSFVLGYSMQMVGHFYFEKNDPGEAILIRKIIKWFWGDSSGR